MYSADGTHQLGVIDYDKSKVQFLYNYVLNSNNNKPAPGDFRNRECWFTDIQADGYSDGVNWFINGIIDGSVITQSNFVVINTLSELSTIPSYYTSAFVTDSISGGEFNWASTGTVDNGITFAGSTGYWKRCFDNNSVKPEWWGAIGDDSTDCANAIKAAIAALPNGGTIVLEGEIYRLSDGITLLPYQTLHFRPGSIWKMTGGADEKPLVTMADNTKIENATLVETRAYTTPWSTNKKSFGIYGFNISDIRIEGCTVTGFHYVNVEFIDCDEIAITNNIIQSAGSSEIANYSDWQGDGIHIIAYSKSVSNFIITNNRIINNGRYGIMAFTYSTYVVTDFVFNNNISSNNGDTGFNTASSGATTTLDGFTISNNVFLSNGINSSASPSHTGGQGIQLDKSINGVVSGNTICNCTENGINSADISRVIFTGNLCRGNTWDGIHVYSSSESTSSTMVQINGGIYEENGEYGINFEGVSLSDISNVISRKNQGYGIRLEYIFSQNCSYIHINDAHVIDNNVFGYSGYSGILIAHSNNIYMRGITSVNIADTKQVNGIRFYTATNCTLDNAVLNGSSLPILIEASSTGIIVNMTGTGTPQYVIHGSPGSIFRRTDGGEATTLYVKETEDGTTTGWVAK